MAPLYDIVTTVADIPRDVPALSLAGTKKWWQRKTLERFAVTHLLLPVGKIGRIFQEMAEAVNDTRALLATRMTDHPEFREVGSRMLTAWDEGVREQTCGHP